MHGDPSGSWADYICYPQLAPDMFTATAQHGTAPPR
jgi:hypothetical protein